MDKKLVNQLKKSNFKLKQANKDYQSAIIQYIIFEVLKLYFATTMLKQKNDRNIFI